MEPKTVYVTLHIDEELSHGNLEDFRDVLLHENEFMLHLFIMKNRT